jgi:GNAT superfamily N-acetyltransferase
MTNLLPVLTRIAEPADLHPAVHIWQQANTARGKPPSQDRITRVRAKLIDPVGLTIVAVHGDDLVGMSLAEPGRDHDGAGPRLPALCHISMVFVHPRHWGRRIGQQLLDSLAEHAAHRGHTRLQLWTGTSNHPAQRLYQQAGFQPSGRTKHIASGEPVIHLIRNLS